jgi:adenine phosphoribosyltransferase
MLSKRSASERGRDAILPASYARLVQDLSSFIIDVPDFPKPGIVFKDFTPLLGDPKGLALAIEYMSNPFRGLGIDTVVGAESRGFIFGIAVAQALSAGFVPVRKAGKLPRQVRSVQYALEYGTDRLEMHSDALAKSKRVLIVDDLLATGGTLEACTQLVRETSRATGGVEIVGISVLIELTALAGSRKLRDCGLVRSALKY